MQAKIIILLLLLLTIKSNNLSAQINADTVPVIELKGNAYQRGLQHGTLLKQQIGEVFLKWKKNIQRNTGHHPDTVLTRFINATNFIPITKKYSPGILEEIKGIAGGSGQSFADVFAFQLVDELWVYLDKQYHTTGHHCSSIGVASTANSPACIAQNIDLENYMQGYQLLLHLLPNNNEPEQYIITCAGLVALGGMNEKGIGLCMNSVMELQAAEDGLPVAFMVRAVLAKENGTDAMLFLKETKHASGQNYILGIADSVFDFEASANKVVRFIPPTKNNIVYHTNHPLANEDVKPWYKKYQQQLLAGETKERNSETRFASLQQRLNTGNNNISADIIKETLRAKDDPYNPVCRAYKQQQGGGFTFSSVVYTLTGKKSVQVTYGPPDQATYREYYLNNIQ